MTRTQAPSASPPRSLLSRLGRHVFPRTLLWQTFLLIAVLLGLTLAAWSQIFRYFEEPARARELARMVSSVVNLTRSALINAESGLRTDMLIELAALEGLRVQPSAISDQLIRLPDSRPMQLLEVEIRRRLGMHTRLAREWNGIEGFWVSFRLDPIDPTEYWVMLPAERFERPPALDWLVWGSAGLFAALLGAFWVVSRISSPLRELARAAQLIGRGKHPPAVAEDGPLEVAYVARAFNQMNGDLARTDADRALILAGVSHDLRTPLARLRLGVELSGGSDDDVDAMVSDIEEMDRIIGQFLDFGRGQSQEGMAEVNLAQMLSELAEPYRLRGVDLQLTLPARLDVTIRPLQMRRAVTNLIDNALRYAGERAPIALSARTHGQLVLVEVADRGPGIPPDQVERLRQPFTRLEHARSNTKGAGLGLAIIERIMSAHQGALDLLPRSGGGLRAVLRFPGHPVEPGNNHAPATIRQGHAETT